MQHTRSDIFDRVLEGERQRNMRYLNGARFVAVSLFLLIRLGSDYLLLDPARRRFPWVLLAYFCVGGLLFLGARGSARIARLSAVAVPFLDLPLVFLSQFVDMPDSTNERSLANFTLSVFVLLVMLSGFMLQTRQVVLAGCIAALLQLTLQFRAGDSTIGKVGGVAVLGVAVALCCFELARRVAMAHHLAAEQLHRERLGRYFSPQVAAHIQQTGLGLAGGQQCVITVLFADLRHFTTLCERLTPAETMALLNDFQSRMVAAVFAHGGTLDKFMGDGLMAYFGAPVEQADHPVRALQCALAMQSALAELNSARTAKGQPALRMGIGLHTGPAIVGAMGTEIRREFTAVGDAVNVASRLENLTRHYDEDILLSGETAQRAGDTVRLRALEEATVRGRTRPVRLFAPVRG